MTVLRQGQSIVHSHEESVNIYYLKKTCKANDYGIKYLHHHGKTLGDIKFR